LTATANLTPRQLAEELRLVDIAARIDEDAGRIGERCPACSRTALLTGSVVGHFDVTDAADLGAGSGLTLTEMALHAKSLRCPLCGLHLVGTEELEEADVQVVRKLRYPTDEGFADFLDSGLSIDDVQESEEN
jgi:hypothetical protein